MEDAGRLMKPLNREQALRKLRDTGLGRIVFTHRAMPVIRPVNHLIDDGQVIIRSHEGSAIVAVSHNGQGTVVVYEADDIDTTTRTGWSVMVTGMARLVTDPGQAARYEHALRPWIAGQTGCVIRIDPQLVTGYELAVPDPVTTGRPGAGLPAGQVCGRGSWTVTPQLGGNRPRQLSYGQGFLMTCAKL